MYLTSNDSTRACAFLKRTRRSSHCICINLYECGRIALTLRTANPNEYLILRNENKSALAMYEAHENRIRHIDKVPAFGITPRNSEQTFAIDALLNDRIRWSRFQEKPAQVKHCSPWRAH